jgi:hypothetical protein
MSDNEDDFAISVSQSEFDMFCWGNTVNGELGLGDIEEAHILLPRELNFNKTTNIKEGEFNGLYIHTHMINLWCNKCGAYSERPTALLIKEEPSFQNT